MAQDFGNKNENVAVRDIDLDEVDADILVIAKSPAKLNQAAAFLSRRGWPTTVLSDVVKAVEYVAENNPDFVLFSLNAQNPALQKLPTLFASTFNTTCVAFIESSDAASASRLANSKFQHKIMGHPSGPTLHRAIRGIMSQQLSVGELSSSSGAAIIKGEGTLEDQNVRIMGEEKEVLSAGKYTMAKPTRVSLKDLLGRSSEPVGKEFLLNLKQQVFGTNFNTKETDSSMAVPPSLSPAPSSIEELVGSVIQELGDASPVKAQIGSVTELVVFPVASETSPGYIILAGQFNKETSQDFFERVESSFKRQFAQAGISGEIQPGFWISVPEINVIELAQDSATLMVESVYQGIEFGAAFFKSERALPEVRDVNQGEMVAINLDDISAEHPIPFKAYLHMPANSKYFLYLRNGRRLQHKQKTRLQNSNVTDLFLKRVDVENVRMFLAASFFRNLIEIFKAAA